MPNKPQYIVDLEAKMDTMEELQQENAGVLREIHICLAGTEFDQQATNGEKGGGVVRRLGRVEKKITLLQIWKTKTVTRNAIIWIIVGGALSALWMVFIVTLK